MALEETAPAAIGRRGLFAAAAGAGAVVLASCGGDDGDGASPSEEGGAATQRPLNDAEAVSLLLRVERTEVALLQAVLRQDLLSGKAREYAQTFRDHEQAHVARLEDLRRSLGAEPNDARRPQFQLTKESALATVADVQQLSSSAYLALIARTRAQRVRSALVAIHSTEAQHAAVMRRLAERDYTPDGAVAKPLGITAVKSRLEDLGA